MMVRATYNGVVLAESDKTQVVEGNHYFPPESVNREYFSETDTHTTCPWKGLASYYTITIGDEALTDAAWTYPNAKDAAKAIENHVAFYKMKGIQIEHV
jgi:uncharacterized protein (DUF427 family)